MPTGYQHVLATMKLCSLLQCRPFKNVKQLFKLETHHIHCIMISRVIWFFTWWKIYNFDFCIFSHHCRQNSTRRTYRWCHLVDVVRFKSMYIWQTMPPINPSSSGNRGTDLLSCWSTTKFHVRHNCSPHFDNIFSLILP